MKSFTNFLSSIIAVPMATDMPEGLWKRILAVMAFFKYSFCVMTLPKRTPAAAKSFTLISAHGLICDMEGTYLAHPIQNMKSILTDEIRLVKGKYGSELWSIFIDCVIY